MSLIDRVRAVIHKMDGQFSVQEITKTEPNIDTHGASVILSRLCTKGELDSCGMVRRGITRTRYYIKTSKLQPAKNLDEPIRKASELFVKPSEVKMGKGVLGIRIHRLGS